MPKATWPPPGWTTAAALANACTARSLMTPGSPGRAMSSSTNRPMAPSASAATHRWPPWGTASLSRCGATCSPDRAIYTLCVCVTGNPPVLLSSRARARGNSTLARWTAAASPCATARSPAPGAASTISTWPRRANPKSKSVAGRMSHSAPVPGAFMPRGARLPASNGKLPAPHIRRNFPAPAHSRPWSRFPMAACWWPGKKAARSLPRGNKEGDSVRRPHSADRRLHSGRSGRGRCRNPDRHLVQPGGSRGQNRTHNFSRNAAQYDRWGGYRFGSAAHRRARRHGRIGDTEARAPEHHEVSRFGRYGSRNRGRIGYRCVVGQARCGHVVGAGVLKERRRESLQLRGCRSTGQAVVGDYHADRAPSGVRWGLHVDLRRADVVHEGWLAIDGDADAVERRRKVATHHLVSAPGAAGIGIGQARALDHHPGAGLDAGLETGGVEY